MRLHAGQQRKCTVLQFHHHAPERVLGLLVRDLEQLQDHGLVGAQHGATGDAKQQRVSDLTCGTSDGNANGFFAHDQDSRKKLEKLNMARAQEGSARTMQKPGKFTFERQPSSICLMSYIRYDSVVAPASRPASHANTMPSTPSTTPIHRPSPPNPRLRQWHTGLQSACTGRSRDLILKSLQAGEWKPGESIPSEMDLAARFRVSQGTVRKAIDELAADHLLVRRQGKGTFVATHAEQHVQYRFLKLVPDFGDASSEGPAQREIIDCKRLRASAEVARALGLRTGDSGASGATRAVVCR